MKSKKIIIALAGLSLCASPLLSLVSCNQPAVDYGTVTIENITVDEGDRAVITPTFSIPANYENFEYTFEGENISIDNGKVTGNVGDTTTIVTAKSEHFETTFSVYVEPDRGTLKIPQLTCYLNYDGVEPAPVFSKEKYAEDLTYTYESECIKFENGKFFALSAGSTTVTATSKHFSAKFKVIAAQYEYESSVASYESAWKNNGEVKGQTMFIGDSFFDPAFWSKFYSMWSGYNVLQHGISATTTTDWMKFAERIVFPQEPVNIVMHIGTNDIYDDGYSANGTISNLKTLFEYIHAELPNTKVYWFGIEPRTYTASAMSGSTVKGFLDVINNNIKEYAEASNYLTYLDSPSFCYDSNGNVISSFFRDGTHPTVENYSYYKTMLLESGIQIEREEVSDKINDIKRSVGESVSTSPEIIYKGNALVNNFDLKGKLHVGTLGNNPHIEFRFDGDYGNRFLLWSQENDGVLKVRYACGGTYANTDSKKHSYTVGSGLDLTWELVVSSKNAYLYINDVLELVMLNANVKSSVNIGSENVACEFTEMSAKSKIEDSADFADVLARSEISKYEENTSTSKKVVCPYLS